MELQKGHVALLVAIATGNGRLLNKYGAEAIDFAEAVLGMKFGTGHLRERICLAVMGAVPDAGQHGYDGTYKGRFVEVKTEQLDEESIAKGKKIAGRASFTTATNKGIAAKFRDKPIMLHGAFVGSRLAALFQYNLADTNAKKRLMQKAYGCKDYKAAEWPAKVKVLYVNTALCTEQHFTLSMLEKLR